jgi:hypothetical protein
MTMRDFEKAERLINQVKPVIEANNKLEKAYSAGIKEPPGHPNMHPVRAAMKDLEAALADAIGHIARNRRDDDLERARRQARNKK